MLCLLPRRLPFKKSDDKNNDTDKKRQSAEIDEKAVGVEVLQNDLDKQAEKNDEKAEEFEVHLVNLLFKSLPVSKSTS